MKKIKRYFMAVALLVSLVCLAVGLVACDKGAKIVDLRIENAQINFMRGDVFDTGEDFTVTAVFGDGTEKDVTAEVVIRQESGMDMNVPGNYQITVSYGKKKAIYTVYVNDAEDVLRKIELDTANVKKTYELGDTVSYENLRVKLTYENSQGALFDEETTSLKGFAVEIKDADGVKSGNVFTSLGKFTVTLSKSGLKASYEVNVAGVNISTVQGALTVGSFYKDKVVSGEAVVKEQIADHELNESFRHQYTFGDNYTRLLIKSSEAAQSTNTYHCSVDGDGLFVVRVENGKIVSNNINHPDMINGSPYYLWYYKDTVYGIEGVLNKLYERAKVCSNNDLKETADEDTRRYSFSFTGLEQRSNSVDYFETTVSFTLSEDYTIASVEYRQDYYEDNSAWAEGERTFETDPVTGKTRPLTRPSHYTIVTVTQTVGERTEKNEYSRDMFKISSFDLMYNGNKLENGAVFKCDKVTSEVEGDPNGKYELTIGNILPSTASFAQDRLYLDYEGNRNGASAGMISNEHFTVTHSEGRIFITARHGGRWTVYFTTAKFKFTLVLDITGADPTSIAPKLWSAANGNFYEGGNKTLALNGVAYFYGAVNAYANGAQEAVITSGDTANAVLQETEIDGIACYKFSASQAGTYAVTVTSTANPALSCTFTFTVSDAANFDDLLTGAYTAKDMVGNIYTLTFSRSDEGGLIRGEVLITRTPTDENDVPIEGEAVSQTLAFYVEGTEITVEHSDSDKIYIDLSVNEENELVLVDQRGGRITLTRVGN